MALIRESDGDFAEMVWFLYYLCTFAPSVNSSSSLRNYTKIVEAIGAWCPGAADEYNLLNLQNDFAIDLFLGSPYGEKLT